MKLQTLLHYALLLLFPGLILSKCMAALFGLHDTLNNNKSLLFGFDLLHILLVALGVYMFRRWRKNTSNTDRDAAVAANESFERTLTELSFPLLLMDDTHAPELLISPEEAASCNGIEGCTLYSKSGVFTISRFSQLPVPTAQLTKESELELAPLKEHLLSCLNDDDDLMTQFHDKEVLEHLLSPCDCFEEILCWGTITGGIPYSDIPGLPEVAEDEWEEKDISELPELQRITAPDYTGKLTHAYIRRCADHIRLTTHPDFLPLPEKTRGSKSESSITMGFD